MSRYSLPRSPSPLYTPRRPAAEDKRRRQAKQYDAHGAAGCVLRRKARQTGTFVGIYRTDQTDFDGRGEPWVIVCEEHGSVVGCPSLSLAKDQATEPDGWCDRCVSK